MAYFNFTVTQTSWLFTATIATPLEMTLAEYPADVSVTQPINTVTVTRSYDPITIAQGGPIGYTGSQGVGYTGSAGSSFELLASSTDGTDINVGTRGNVYLTAASGNYNFVQGMRVRLIIDANNWMEGELTYYGPFLNPTNRNMTVNVDTSSNAPYGQSLAFYVRPSSSRGASGPTGPIGYAGSLGYSGSRGYTGSASTVSGPQGPQGVSGPQGALGYTGSRGLSGPQGPASTVSGPQGPQGYTGSIGNLGYTGSASTISGPQGPQGLSGPTGAVGYNGSLGYTGSIGYSGSAGADGKTWYYGSGAPSSGIGVLGDFYFRTDTGAVYIKNLAGVPPTLQWVQQFNARGFTGSQGYDGSIGYTGSASTISGPQGPQGDVGFTGSQGLSGPQGAQGLSGPTGAQGVSGPTGAQGVSGPQGPQGNIGYTGSVGPGVPSGGAAGEYLVKNSATNYDLVWTDRVNAKTIYETVKNVSGGSLSKGTPVYQVGMAGNTVTVGAARADTASKSPAIGILDETIADQAEGRMLILGEIKGVDTSTFSVGDKVYLGATGGYTNSPPTGSTDLQQFLGVVFRVDNTNGSGYITGTLAEDMIRYRSGVGYEIWNPSGNYWETLTITGGYTGSRGSTGYTGSASTVSGPQGPAGSNGSIGYTGSAGTLGLDGPTGPAGSAGASGPQGPAGSNGSIGYTGSAGSAGASGPQGPVGYTGSAITTAYTFDGGQPSSNYTNGPAFDCGGVN